MRDDYWADWSRPRIPWPVPTPIWTSPDLGCALGSWMPCARPSHKAPGARHPTAVDPFARRGPRRRPDTVADAYAELIAEGWLIARQGSGTRVAGRAEPRRVANAAAAARPAPLRLT